MYLFRKKLGEKFFFEQIRRVLYKTYAMKRNRANKI